MIGIFVDNCKEIFNKRRTSSGKSKKNILKAIKKYSSKRKSLKRKYAQDLKKQIIEKMQSCPEQNTIGDAPNSCDGALKMSSSNFCLKSAVTCSNNMLACQDKAKNVVAKHVKVQKAHVKKYIAKVEAFKFDIEKQFKIADQTLKNSAQALSGMHGLGVVYEEPIGLKMNRLKDKFLKGPEFYKELKLEDPKEYLKLVKEDIKNLKEKVEQNHKDLMNGDPDAKVEYKGILGESDKYKKNLRDENKLWEDTAKNCLALRNKFDNEAAAATAKENEAIAKSNADTVVACDLVAQFEEHPAGFCKEDVSEFLDDISAVTSSVDRVALKNIGAFGRVCKLYGSQSSNTHDTTGSTRHRNIAGQSLKEYCEGDGKDFFACDTLANFAPSGDISKLCYKNGPVQLDKDSNEFAGFRSTLDEGYCYEGKGEDIEIIPKAKATEKCATPSKAISSTSSKNALSDYIMDDEVLKDRAREYVATQTGEGNVITCTDISRNNKVVRAAGLVEAQIEIQEQQRMLSDMGGVPIAKCNATMNNGVGKTPGYGQQEGAFRDIASGAAGLFQ
jgi:hypothetical protein